MYALIRKWESSGLSQLKFLEQTGVSKSTFGYWRKRYLEEQGAGTSATGKFIPVKVSPDKKSLIKENHSLEIIYPNGVRLLCPAVMNLASIKELIV